MKSYANEYLKPWNYLVVLLRYYAYITSFETRLGFISELKERLK